jgi:hypothetical protein
MHGLFWEKSIPNFNQIAQGEKVGQMSEIRPMKLFPIFRPKGQTLTPGGEFPWVWNYVSVRPSIIPNSM